MNVTVQRRRPSRLSVLLVLCAATLAISLATTAINVALPSLALDFQANNRELQWIVDAYNLLFATFVLAFGSLSDRYGRKGALLLGLTIFGGGAVGASFAESAGQLIAWQAVMGLGAAFVYPTTLSILSNVFTERTDKAKAIGIWGRHNRCGRRMWPPHPRWLVTRALLVGEASSSPSPPEPPSPSESQLQWSPPHAIPAHHASTSVVSSCRCLQSEPWSTP